MMTKTRFVALGCLVIGFAYVAMLVFDAGPMQAATAWVTGDTLAVTVRIPDYGTVRFRPTIQDAAAFTAAFGTAEQAKSAIVDSIREDFQASQANVALTGATFPWWKALPLSRQVCSALMLAHREFPGLAWGQCSFDDF